MDIEQSIDAAHSAIDVLANQFDHEVWSGASPIMINRYWSAAAAPVERHCEARIIWSDSALVVRFTCNQHEPLVVSSNPRLDSKTVGLWVRDVCEVFVAPDPHHPDQYFEFEAAPTGEWLDLEIRLTAEGRQTNWEFHSGMTAAGRVMPNEVTVTMHIPWSGWSAMPQAGDRWGVNLFRCVGRDPGRGYLAWRPTYTAEPGFHVPHAFGCLRFV